VTILVAGGAGFVGASLVESLLQRGGTVLVVDNFSSGSPTNLQGAKSPGRLEVIEADIVDFASFRAAVLRHTDLGPVTDVWHLAANSDIPAGITDASVDLKNTFLTTFNILELMSELGSRRMFFASSSAIYGDLGQRVLSEDAGPLFPISNYGAMKLASEALITAAAEKFLDRAVLFRFPNVVGVPATHGVLLDFIRRLKQDRTKLKVLGDGTQQKSYLHVSDLVSAMRLVEADFLTKVEAVNIGPNDEGVTVRRIAEETIAIVAPNASIQFGTENRGWIGDVPRFVYSTAKIRSRGWRPALDSLDAIRLAIRQIAEQEGAI
jgi:UDP-glucose 4-epimerase